MSDFLSQDQIDALLNSQNFEGDDDASSIGSDSTDAGSESSTDSLRAAIAFFCSHAESVIGTVLNKEVKFSLENEESLDLDTLASTVEKPILYVTIPFTAGLADSLHIVISTTLVAMLSDLMLMGDGSAEYTEDHKDALGELFG